MLDPRNDNAPTSKSLTFSLSDAVASRFLDDFYSQQPDPESIQDAATASSDATPPTPGSSDSSVFVPPVPGSSDAAAPSSSGKKPFVPPTPGTSDPDGWQVGRGSVKHGDYLDVDASTLFKKPTSEKAAQVRIDELRKLMQNDPELKQAYSDKLQALQKPSSKLTDTNYLKLKEGAKKFFGSEKKVPGFNDKLDLQDIPLNQEKTGRERENLTDAQIAKMKAAANKFPLSEKVTPSSTGKLDMQDVPKQKEIDKTSELTNIKKDKIVGGQHGDGNIQQKPLKKPAPVKDRQDEPAQVNGEDEAIREFEMSRQPSGKKPVTLPEEDSTIQPKPLKKPAPIKDVQETPQTNAEDDAIREFESSRSSSSSSDSGDNDTEPADEAEGESEESEFFTSIEIAEAESENENPAPAVENVNINDLGPKSEDLTAERNEQKNFVARTNDGSNIEVRRDGTCTLNSSEGRTKVSPDGVVTITANGTEQHFHFDNASRIKVHPDGSRTHYFREGTTVTELRQGGEPSGLIVRQPKGTAVRTDYDRPSQLRYSPATEK